MQPPEQHRASRPATLPPFDLGSERRIDLRGTEAIAAGRRLGWAQRELRTTPHLTGDWLVDGDFFTARLGFVPSTLTTSWSSRPENRVRCSLILQGSGIIQVGDREPRPFSAGSMALIDTSQRMTLVADEPVLGVYLSTRWSRLIGVSGTDPLANTPLQGDATHSKMLAALINSALSADIGGASPTLGAVRRSLEAMVDACVTAQTDRAIFHAESKKHLLYEEAMRALEAGFTDPRTTPESVARSLGVPLRYLERVSREAGISPARRLRTLRAAHAIRLREASPSPISLRDLAEASGFVSVSTLQRALRDLASRGHGEQEGFSPR